MICSFFWNLLDSLSEEKLKEGVRLSTVNRMLGVVRAILMKAEREWDWLDRTCYKDAKRRFKKGIGELQRRSK